MFYSQFILAKKGPLGTIWIAAHLERKLRKNQVADTDIGDSVDSILSPDVPIALRLSSHLLLGVVRIYSKKVNYLFDDCSEALLKVKQAFRSAAVDLPPEQSKAPYHSITMPETFDLDDFELPDNDILQGNFVDHHISSREQITLQDTMEGVSYSTSKFGLDETFGDGDASLLDLDEELLLGKSQISESLNLSSDIGTSMPLFKQDELEEFAAMGSGSLVDGVGGNAVLFDDAQAPSTPGLVQEPNLPKASASDEHLESDYHMMEKSKNGSAHEDKNEADWSSRNTLNAELNADVPIEESAYKSKLHRESVQSSAEDPTFELKTINEIGDSDALADIQRIEDFGKRDSDEDKNFVVSDKHTDENIDFEKSAHEISGVTSLDEVSMNCQESHGVEDSTRQPGKQMPECDITDIYAQFDAAVLESSGKRGEEPIEREMLMSAPEGDLVGNRPALDNSGVEPGGFVDVDDGSKSISGKKRSITESTLTEQSLNATESSKRRQVSVPDDDDLLSSILVGRSSALKVKATPRLSEVTSEKRIRSAPRTGASKRKVLMDDTMVLHGDMIRQQLVDTEDIQRVRKKAPCSSTEVSTIQRQYLEDEIFLEPVFSGTSSDLSLLHRQPHIPSGITVDVQHNDLKHEDSSAFAAEARETSQNAENFEILGNEKDDSGRRLSTTEQSREDIEATDIQPWLDTGLEASLRNEDDEAVSSFVFKNGQSVKDASSVELNSYATDALNGNAVNDDDLEANGSNIIVNIETKQHEIDDGLKEGNQDFVNMQTNARDIDYDMIADDLLGDHDQFLNAGDIDLDKDVFNEADGNLYDMVGAEDLMLYRHDQDVPEFPSGENDTEFLNLDDDDDEEEQNDEANEPTPDDEDARFAETTGWSSRTRAVSKYLRTLFIKEAESGGNCVSMENLLNGKSRKEASRMFFETLVLKTRDHIHVEQPNPFGNISIKPRTRLMKLQY